MKKITLKDFLFAAGTLVLGIGLGIIVWLTAMNGAEKIKEKNSVSSVPSYIYSGFYYNRLEDDEKAAYEKIKEEIESMPEKIQIPILEDEESLNDVFEALFYENPTYFFLSPNCQIETTSFGKCYFIPEYSISLLDYQEQKAELEKVRSTVLEKAANLTDDFEKELLAHDYIVNRCEYVEKTGGTYSSAYGCLVRGYASCEGYAKAMKYLLDEMGIENHLALGSAENNDNESVGHAWNTVKIDGNYYHIDATWDDPMDASVEKRYSYFNITDKEITKTHEPEERFLGLCTQDDENYYVKNGISFSSYDGDARNAITSELVRQVKLGNDAVSFKFTNKTALSDAKEALFEMNGIYSILLSANVLTDEVLTQDKVTYIIDEKYMIITFFDFIR